MDQVNKKRGKSRSRTQHRREEDGAGEEQMALRVEAFVREEVLFDDLHVGRQTNPAILDSQSKRPYLSTDEQFQRERREHVQSKTESGDVNQGVVLRCLFSVS